MTTTDPDVAVFRREDGRAMSTRSSTASDYIVLLAAELRALRALLADLDAP